jgi:hypothetical protein
MGKRQERNLYRFQEKGFLTEEKKRFYMPESRKRASSASVIWHVVSFGQDGTYRPVVKLFADNPLA